MELFSNVLLQLQIDSYKDKYLKEKNGENVFYIPSKEVSVMMFLF